MNIALIISSLGCGGAERVLIELAKHFSSHSHNITIITLENEDHDFYGPPENVKRINIASHLISKNIFEGIFNNISKSFRIRSILNDTQPDLVISFMTQTNIVTIFSAIGTAIPIIISEHCHPFMIPLKMQWSILRRITYPFCNYLVSVSKGINDCFNWLPLEKRYVIYNPVTDMIYKDSIPNDVIDPKYNHIIAMGRLDYQKGFDILIDAFSIATKDQMNWKLIILGEGEKKEDLTIQIKKSGLTDKIELIGRIANPFPILYQCDLFVCSSRSEGFGNVIIEAMACGIPVISTNCPSGPAEIIQHNINGILVESENSEALAVAMSELMKNKEKRKCLSEEALKSVSRFHPDKIMNQWESLIYEVTNVKS